MAGPGTSQEILAEIASRPGRDTVLSFVVKAAFIATSLLFLAALLFAPLITVFATACRKAPSCTSTASATPTRWRRSA
jgi:ABC-type sulfate transport system permease subunit